MKIKVRLTEKEFIGFGWFDALRVKRAWRGPALFAAILGGAAALCLIFYARRGTVLPGVA